MAIQDYLIQQEGKDWGALLSAWGWFLPESFTVWMVNRFGDMVLVQDDGTVCFFDPGAGKMNQVASSREEFADLADDPEKFDLWFMPQIVDSLLQSGLSLKDSQCYGYKLPPGLGGSYELDNIEATDLSIHYHILGQIFEHIKDVPDGTKITFQIKDTPDGSRISYQMLETKSE